MKKINMLFLALTVALTATASLATAEDNPSDYFALKAGVYSPSTSHDLENFNGGHRTHLDSKTGFNGEVAVGHYFLPMLALELGAGYFESKGSAAAEPGELKLKVVPLTATGKVLVQLGPVEPYGLFGIGAYVTDMKIHDNETAGTLRDSTKVTYGLHAGAGVNINFSKSMFVGVEGKYIWADPSFGGEHIKLDGFLATGVLGFRL
jgi:opacity protein-like surface antigen